MISDGPRINLIRGPSRNFSFPGIFAEWAFDGADVIEQAVDGRNCEARLDHHAAK
jgi:hypothetical protein